MAYDVNIVGHINDDIMNTLLGLGFTEGQINDRMYAHLGSLGYTGQINDRYLQAGGKKQYIEDLLSSNDWILEDGTWNDGNVWVDTDVWNDS